MKFRGELGGRGTVHNGRLHWPGTTAGFPLRHDGPIPLLKEHERQQAERHTLDYHCRRFCLWEPQDMKDWVDTRDRIANGWYLQLNRIDKWDDAHQYPIIFLEWVQIYGEFANAKRPPVRPEAPVAPPQPTVPRRRRMFAAPLDL